MEILGFICVLLLASDVYGVEEAALCSLPAAQTCMMERELQFQTASTAYQENLPSADLKTLCMTQLKSDRVGECFVAWTELCTEEEGRDIRQQWEDLNIKIVNLCQQVCPNINELPDCKSKVQTDEIQNSKFESFCNSFNESLQCAERQLNDCSFGMSLYDDIIAPTFLGYWQYICNSGCHNIDETVLVIRDCVFELKKAPRDRICEFQARFKTCVFENPTVCPEVLSLVVFRYRTYNRVEQMCKPIVAEPATPVTTTTQTTEKTTPSTAQSTDGQTQPVTVDRTTAHEAKSGGSHESLARDDTNVTKVDPTTIPPTTTTAVTKTTTSKMMTDTSGCLSEEDIDMFTQTEGTNMYKVMFVLEFESCLHNKTNDLDDLRNIMAVMPSHFLQSYHQTKRESWSFLKAAAPPCPEDGEGCSGHQYGYISCKSGSSRQTESRLLQTFLLVLGAWRLTLHLGR